MWLRPARQPPDLHVVVSTNRRSRQATYAAVCSKRATLLGNADRANRKLWCGRNRPSGWTLSVQVFGPGGTRSEYRSRIFWIDGRRTWAAAKAPQRKRPCRSRATARRSLFVHTLSVAKATRSLCVRSQMENYRAKAKKFARLAAVAKSLRHSRQCRKLAAEGRGRPASVAAFLSVNAADLLKKEGLRGNWLQLGDDEEDGPIGLVAELEAIAQTAFRQATHRLQRHLSGELRRETELEKVVCPDESAGQSKQAGVMARPARISKARRILGKVFRT